MPRSIFENIVIQNYKQETFFKDCKYAPIRFFEILFIEEGEGLLSINGHNVPYSAKQLFIFVPNDKYTFEVNTPTSVSTIKFLKSFFANVNANTDTAERIEWFKKIEILLYSTNRTASVEINTKGEEGSLYSLLSVMNEEYNNTHGDKIIIKNMLNSILHIISRNVSYVSSKTPSSKIQEIINYIHANIYHSELLTLKELANQFNVSENYIGQYFKKQMDITLKKYILNYKIKLGETRLKYTDLTLLEIASEFGFSDSSHLDKTFIAYKGMTAGAYRCEQHLNV
ncbi:AraC family transcriptional regulator [Saccharicrinis aurantiacus]|uniref:AraC family transcriptional regulator n=1 Tax=Saccharicrinis aurantiacus TaxID=1849719 RepID=UPI00249023FF|nr:AraC family transcriptional regulator [Saccharicrinis aurantiacus]